MFQRVGEATDVVSKEMYEFTDLGGRHVALRPEQTASVCRAFVQHRPTTPWKAWYAGPNFRYEKPQRGRYRQFDQVGVEVLGVDDPYLDVEVIALGWRFFEALGLRQVTLLLNSLGEPADRARYVEALRAHFEADLDALTAESREHARAQPAAGPRLQAPARRRRHRRRAAAGRLPRAPRPPRTSPPCAPASTRSASRTRVDPRLVRGLDYYLRTTFEFAGGTLDGAQNALGGGGRYDGLVEALGGPPTPGVGFALGARPHAAGLRRRGRVRRAATGRRRVRRRHDRRRRGARRHRRAAPGRASAPTGPTTAAA